MFRNTFDPVEWRAIYDSPNDPGHFTFHRGSVLAIQEVLQIAKPGELWIDVGCGTGNVAAELATRGLRMIGIDHDPQMIAAASQQFANLKFLHSTADHLPFSANDAEGIIATSFMGCLDSPDHFYNEAFRILKPSGKLVLTFTNRSRLLLRLQKCDKLYHLYSPREVSEELRKAGFQIGNIRYYNFFLKPWNKMIPPVRFALAAERFGNSAISRFFARNFLVVASKKFDLLSSKNL